MVHDVASGDVRRGVPDLSESFILLNKRLQSDFTLEAVGCSSATVLAELFGLRSFAVYLNEASSDAFRLCAALNDRQEVIAGSADDPTVPRSAFHELMLAEYRINRSYALDRHHRWTPEQLQLFTSPRLGGGELSRECLLVPLLKEGKELLGVFVLHLPADQDWAELSLELMDSLESFATYVALVVKRVHHYEELKYTTTSLESQLLLRSKLLDLSSMLLCNHGKEELFSQVACVFEESIGLDAMEIRLAEGEGSVPQLVFSRGESAGFSVQAFGDKYANAIGWVVSHNTPRAFSSIDPRRGESAVAIVPLAPGGKVGGVLCLARKRVFTEIELESAQLLTNIVAIALQNIYTFEWLQQQATSDGLTGIHNHRYFCEMLVNQVNRAERYDETFCLLMMDLDHFKRVNDTLGHQGGDDVLRAVTAVLRKCSRDSDVLARYGGEEFVLILPNTKLAAARALAERIREAVARLDDMPGGVRVTISIGVAAFSGPVATADAVLAAADAALLRAKATGRDRVCLHRHWADTCEDLGSELAEVGCYFAQVAGFSDAEVQGLVAALAACEGDRDVCSEVASLLTGSSSEEQAKRYAMDALLYGGERWDGSGYPEGLSGSAIPYAARAFAICRCYDTAIANGDCPHAVLRAAAFTELDPRMVQQFTAMLRSGEVAAS